MKARGLTKETILSVGITEKSYPTFNVGDTIVVDLKVKEGDKERIQAFEGDVIDIHHNGIASTFTVRRIGANGVGVEKILPFHSPTISSIRIIKIGKVRRANIGYIRNRIGKAARIQEKIQTHEQGNTVSDKSAAA